jgi:competence protein ComEC
LFTALPGERWRLTVRLKRTHGFQNPGGFDYEGKLFREGIRATGYLRPGEGHARLAAGGWRGSLDRLRMAARDYISATLFDSPSGPVIAALAVGDAGAIPTGSGTCCAPPAVHLVSISACTSAWWRAWRLVAFLWRRVPALTLCRRASRAGRLLAGGMCSALAGFSVPTQRTWIMLSVVLGAVWQTSDARFAGARGRVNYGTRLRSWRRWTPVLAVVRGGAPCR